MGLLLIALPFMGVMLSMAGLEWLDGTGTGRRRARVLIGCTAGVVATAGISCAVRDSGADLVTTITLLAVVVLATLWITARLVPEPASR
jgi:hypothetical protein